MAAVLHGARHLRQGIGVSKRSGPAHTSRSIHIPAFTPRPAPPPPSTAQRLFSEARTFLSRLVSHLTSTPGLSRSTLVVSPQSSLFRPTQLSNSKTISSRFSLPVRHALSRPFSSPRLPRPPAVPSNVTHVGLGTARAFHSSRPIFQNMVDNVPVATRALWEVEWDLKTKKKEERRIRRAVQNKTAPKSAGMLKPRPKPVIPDSRCDTSELDVYFPIEPTPVVTTHLLVPLAPTPTARLPLSTRAHLGGATHPLLPISDLASVHTTHRVHSLRVSTLFARLDSANVWDDPGVNVDAYAFGPRHDGREKQCTVLRVIFKGWNISRVRDILGESGDEWYSLEETNLDGRPTSVSCSDPSEDTRINLRPESPSLESAGIDSSCVSEAEMDNGRDVMSPLPMQAGASAQHDFVLPTLDFSSAFSDTAASVTPLPPQPAIFLRTISDLTRDAEPVLSSSLLSVDSPPLSGPWECLSPSSSFLQRVGKQR